MICKYLIAFALANALYGQGGLPGYGGPAVSSRGLNGAGTRGSDPVNLTPVADVRATYDNGLITTGLDKNGKIITSGGLFGVEASVGLYGTKSWKRRSLGMDYRGNYRHYNDNSIANGTDHYLGMNYTQQIGRRTAFTAHGIGGTASRALGGGLPGLGGVGSLLASTTDYLGVPQNETFDSRVYFVDGTGKIVRQLDARSSISLGGGAMSVRRDSASLVGLNGIHADADYVRRINRTLSVGVAYKYMHFEYPRAFGEADMHTLSGELSKAIGRSWTIAATAGIMRIDFAGIRQVTLDPLIAELLGQTIGREAFNAINTLPAGSLNISHRMKRSSLGIGYNRGPSAGNGIILAGHQESVSGSYGRVFSRRLHGGASINYSKISGAGSYAGHFATFSMGAVLNYSLTDYVGLTAAFDERHIDVNGNQFKRWGNRMSAGFSFHPRGFPMWPR